MAALLEQIGEHRDAFSPPDVTPPGTQPVRKVAERAAGQRARGGDQSDNQAAAGAPQATVDSPRERPAKSPVGEAASGPVPPLPAARRAAVAAAKTRVLFVLNVVDNLAPPRDAAALPAAAAPPAASVPSPPANGK